MDPDRLVIVDIAHGKDFRKLTLYAWTGVEYEELMAVDDCGISNQTIVHRCESILNRMIEHIRSEEKTDG